MKHSPSFRKTCYNKSRKNFSSSSAKISDDLLLVIDRFPGCKLPIIPSYFPRPCSISPYSPQFPLFFRCSYVLTLNFLSPTKMLYFLPAKFTKQSVTVTLSKLCVNFEPYYRGVELFKHLLKVANQCYRSFGSADYSCFKRK